MSDQPLGESRSITSASSGSLLDFLPLEILYIVFDIARQNSSSTSTFKLSHVCSRWRSFIIHSPSLWTTVLVDRLSLKYHELWFRRSRDRGLSIQIDLPSGIPYHTNRRPLIQQLSETLPRWTEIELAGADRFEDCFSKVLDWLKTEDMQRLTKLRLQYAPGSYTWFPNMIDLTPMPKLEVLDVHTNILTPSSIWISSCHRLRELRLTFIYPTVASTLHPYLYQLIQQIAGHLEVLQITVPHLAMQHRHWTRAPDVPESPELPKTPIHLPRLMKLELSPDSSHKKSFDYAFNPLVPLLHAPNLERVDIMHVAALVHLAEFNPFPSLKELSLIDLWYEEQGVALVSRAFTREMSPSLFGAFSQLSQLRSVSFRNIAWPDAEYASALGASCPQLVTLGLYMCFGVREADLRRLIRRRRLSENVAALQHLSVVNCKGLQMSKKTRSWFGGQVEKFCYSSWTPGQTYAIPL